LKSGDYVFGGFCVADRKSLEGISSLFSNCVVHGKTSTDRYVAVTTLKELGETTVK